MIRVLVALRVRMAWNRITRGPRRFRQMLGAAVTLVFSVGFVLLAGLNAGTLLNGVARTDRSAAINGLPVLLAGVAVLTFVTSLSSAFHHLFLAGDLELLLAAPIPSWSLFGLKTLEIWRDALHIILFQGAALLGFGQSLGLPPSYYVLAILVGALLTLGASAAGAIVALAVARVRFGESVLGLSRLLAILLFLPVGVLGVPALGFGRNRISLLLNPRGVNAVTDQLRSIGDPPTWAPTTWAAHVLLGDDQAWLSGVLFLATATVLLLGMQLAFAGLYQGGWERVRFSPAVRKSARPRLRMRLPAMGLSRNPIGGILLKDWRTVLRDPRWRTGTLVSLVALGLPAMVLFAGDPFARSAHVMSFWFGMVPVPYLAFLVGTQQGASTLSYEGRNVALLRAAPVGMGRVLLAKLFGGLLLVLLVTWTATLTLGVTHAGEPVELVQALMAATWLAVGATLAAVAGAALTADFESDNPQRRVGWLGTIVTSTLSMFFFVTNTGVLVWWVLRSLLNPPRLVLGLAPVMDWGLPLLALVSVAAILIASRLAVRRLATWEFS
jgi:Putative ATP-binding cassette